MQKRRPSVDFVNGSRFIENDKVAIVGGLSCGIDLALHVVERYNGKPVAQGIADDLEYSGELWKNPQYGETKEGRLASNREEKTMNRVLRVTVVLCLACASLPAQEPAAKSKIAKAVDPLAWLVGGVWIADASMMGDGMVRIETRYTWSDNGAFIRFTTHFVTKESTLRNYDGQFFWHTSSKSLRMWYTDARNEITEGVITVDGNTLRFDFRGINFEGQLADLRVTLLRKNNDLYTWQLQEKASDGNWKDLAKLDYVRSA